MPETKQTQPEKPKDDGKDNQGRLTKSKMAAADAAKLVKRMVPKVDDKGNVVRDKDKNVVAVEQAIKADEVMSFAEYDDKVVVVTTSGEKLEAAK